VYNAAHANPAVSIAMAVPLLKDPPHMTVDEFLAWDGSGHAGKLELVDGVVRAQMPASATHAIIQANLARLIGNHLIARKMPCRVATEAPVVPKMKTKRNLRAPDLAVTCAPPSASKTFEMPVLIVEIMSPGNRKETWESIWACATIPSVREFLIVESESVYAEIFRRDADGNWPDDPVIVEAGGMFALSSIGCDIPIEYVYVGTYLA